MGFQSKKSPKNGIFKVLAKTSKSRSSDCFCSETPRKRLLRRQEHLVSQNPLKNTLIFQQETSTEKQQKQENHELLQTKTPNWKGGSVVIYADYFTFGLILLHQEQSHVFQTFPSRKPNINRPKPPSIRIYVLIPCSHINIELAHPAKENQRVIDKHAAQLDYHIGLSSTKSSVSQQDRELVCQIARSILDAKGDKLRNWPTISKRDSRRKVSVVPTHKRNAKATDNTPEVPEQH